ncbi:PAS domain S-box protein [Niveibacterium sp. SC-1]|uniref:PAS domain S-box protein n=1 Tax=Niveibacterium sp. SC-1 TaxID=3135646 RepID=UPI00311D8AA5
MIDLVLGACVGLLAGLLTAGGWWRSRSGSRELAQLVEQSGEIAIHACRRNGEIVLWNAAAERLYGLAANAVIGRKLHELLLPEAEHLPFRLDNERLFDGGRASAPFADIAATLPDGRHILVRSTPMRLGYRGETLVFRLDTDLSVQDALRQQLMGARARLRALSQLPQVGLFETDAGGLLRESSPLFERLAGATRGEHWARLAVPEDAARLADGEAAARRGSPSELELRIRNGQERRLRVQLAAVSEAGTAGGSLVGLAEDISAMRTAEAALRESESKFSRIFHLMPELVMITSQRDGVLLEANDAWEALSGWPRHEAIGRNTRELGLWPTDLDREAMLHRIAEEGGFAGLLDFRRRDGSPLRAEAYVRRIEFAGEPCLLSIVRDVSAAQRLADEAEHARRALLASEAMFAGAFEANPDYISITRASDGKILHANSAFTQLTLWPREQALGMTTIELGLWAYEEDRARVLKQLQRDGTVRDSPATLRRRDGVLRSCLMNTAMFDIEGESCLLAIVRDITTQQETEAAHRESEARFAAFFDMAPIGLVVTDTDGRFERVNQRWCDLFGWSVEEAAGHTTDELSPRHFDDRPARQRMYEELMEVGATTLADLQLRDREDRPVFVTMRGRRIRIGDRERLLWSVEDVGALRAAQARIEELNAGLEVRVSERTRELSEALERLERAQDNLVRAEKLAALGGLVAGIAHDLNTPIGNCVMAASSFRELTRELHEAASGGTLRRSSLERYMSDALGVADVLDRGLARASTLISSFKQVAADQTSEQRRNFRLGQLIDEILLMLAPSLKRARLRVERSIAEDIWLDSYPGPLGQVITNLVTNALAHAFDEQPEGVLRIAGERAGEDEVALRIEDNGAGIPAELLEKVFAPFFTTKREKGGTGLGLHIVSSLVRQKLGGRVEARSQPGEGTTFVIRLPVHAPADTPGEDLTQTEIFSSVTQTYGSEHS